jgi:hypothetical protein
MAKAKMCRGTAPSMTAHSMRKARNVCLATYSVHVTQLSTKGDTYSTEIATIWSV